MANLTTNDKQLLEQLLQMSGGYVLNFTDRTMGEFFRDDVGIDIYANQYNYGSGSKANRIRGFWQTANDQLAGKATTKLIDYIEHQIILGKLDKAAFPTEIISLGRKLVERLTGVKNQTSTAITEDEFISKTFTGIDINKLGLDSVLTTTLTQRLEEIRKCLQAKSSLAVIFLCGSTLEGILLGVAQKNIVIFNKAASSPKDKTGKVNPVHDWKLNDLINVSRELDLIGEDVKKFSHALRDFRNYIHPYEQAMARFAPDEYTAKICWQVLQAGISQLSR